MAADSILIFRSELLPPSETFILEQARTMRSFRPVFAGLKRLPDGLRLSDASMIAMSGPDNSIRDRLRRRFFLEARLGPRFLSQLARQFPALVHSHFAVDACLALPISKRLRIPLVVTLHGYDVTRKDEYLRRTAPGRIYLRRRRELWQNASLFVCASEYIRRKALARGFPEEKLWVHRIGVDLERFRPRTRAAGPSQMVLFAGRLVENKGCIHLIRAMATVQQKLPHARLVILGDGPLRASLETEARARLRNCLFAGMQSHFQVRRWMEQAALLAMPSLEVTSGDSEGLGMVMCEAQALGLPGIAFRGTGVEEALAQGDSGLLVAPGDEPALAEAIVRVLTDESLQDSLGIAGRRNAETRFDLRRQTAILEDKYREVIGSR
ncbi:MAG: glycosyltransferase [Acidobacteriaceae bacterium]|nr:glycosyltransferase [Acidobacteriaceae bacterium]